MARARQATFCGLFGGDLCQIDSLPWPTAWRRAPSGSRCEHPALKIAAKEPDVAANLEVRQAPGTSCLVDPAGPDRKQPCRRRGIEQRLGKGLTCAVPRCVDDAGTHAVAVHSRPAHRTALEHEADRSTCPRPPDTQPATTASPRPMRSNRLITSLTLKTESTPI